MANLNSIETRAVSQESELDIFQLDKLPCELFFALVDYAPESVHDLRLVRMLRIIFEKWKKIEK